MKYFLKTTGTVALFMVITAASSAATISDASRQISSFFVNNPGKTVAVLAFRHSEPKQAGRETTAVQNRFVEQLVALGQVTVIERDRIEQVLKEHQIDQSGLTDKTRIGRLLQADYLLTGTITPGQRGKQLEISARLVEVQTSKITATARATALRSDFSETVQVRSTGNYLGEPLVQIAILLDTSSSMDGLIDQARTQIWKIVNTLANGNREGKKPRIEVALYEYGNSGLSAGENYTRLILPFTSNLDTVSEKLFELKTNGGEEYCGAVIARALAELKWKKYDDVYRVMFIAGNEPFTQGPVDFRPTIERAHAEGIFVNTIFCGDRQQGIATQWQAGAMLAQGDFHVINQDRAVQVMATPYDREIEKLGSEYNETVIPLGQAGRHAEDRMQVQDQKVAAASPASGASVERAIAKNSSQYSANNSWDLTTLFTSKKKIAAVPKTELPAELRDKSQKEVEEYVTKKNQARTKIQNRMNDLYRQRKEYIARESAKSGRRDSFGQALEASVKTQGKKSGMAF
jgi:TolB-like protein